MALEFHPFQDKNKGNVINELSIAVDIILDQLLDLDVTNAKQGFQIDYAVGSDLDSLAAWFDIQRRENEDDEELRNRIKLLIRSRIPVTVDAIQDMFEFITGLRPVIQEDFFTRVYTSGQTPPTNEDLATFLVHFSADIGKVAETRFINTDGESVTVGHTSNIDSGGTIAAYDQLNDPTHQTDISVALDATTAIMTLSGGPYAPSTRIDVEYEVFPDSDFDTLKELQDNDALFERLVNLAKAAGVKTGGVQITKFFKAWFQDGGTEVFSVTDTPLNIKPNWTEPAIGKQYGWDELKWDGNLWDTPFVAVLDYWEFSTNP
jgi:hypothetical protein